MLMAVASLTHPSVTKPRGEGGAGRENARAGRWTGRARASTIADISLSAGTRTAPRSPTMSEPVNPTPATNGTPGTVPPEHAPAASNSAGDGATTGPAV